ncbi:hypothetical protein QTJ16_006403 [Diplocarpon rosae]|uniref:Alpha-carbonic anhydrase domain-containing protein n=1 Tax=Diplocarpon rosae TaxID=946125 RepID=A0AAD9WBS2_9HELO|nr:hypothetical protein QTJ16_006403 [Diplocarpon rosae]
MLCLLLIASFIPSIIACPRHEFNARGSLNKRASGEHQWAYEASFNWGMLNREYITCQIGTQQSPIMLKTSQGLASSHIPTFDAEAYSKVEGELFNWGYGPSFTNPFSTNGPAMKYDDKTLYLKGLHVHSPADHPIENERAKAELHLVHADASGAEKGVIAIRVDPGNAESAFFAQLLSGNQPGSNSSSGYTTSSTSAVPKFDSQEKMSITLNVLQAIKEVNMFSDFWTYQGSLTSPPCTEGIRFWVARNTLYVSIAQMQAILAVSTYSARNEQEVWMHGINR